MSEPCSFFLRVTIEKARYLEFMQAKPSQPRISDNWLQWWDSRKMYNKYDLQEGMRAWDTPNNQEIVNSWLAAQETMAFSEFDEATNMWEFGSLMCSENYDEILPLLVFCESIFPYKIFSPHDFAIIYPYFWGENDVMAYMTFSKDGATLSLAETLDDVAQEHLDYAKLRFDEKYAAFEAKTKDD